MKLIEEEEAGKEADMGEAPPTGDSAHKQAPALWETLLVVARFWVGGPSNQVARRGLAVSSRARGKAPAI